MPTSPKNIQNFMDQKNKRQQLKSDSACLNMKCKPHVQSFVHTQKK